MPKGKAKENHLGLYAKSSNLRPTNSAPQAAAHRRGGTHRVRDEDKTNSIYDDFTRQELKEEAKRRHIYCKDMKKCYMARHLLDDDRRRLKLQHSQTIKRQKESIERRKKRQKGIDERLGQREDKRKPRIEQEQRRQSDESVSDDNISENKKQEEQRRNFDINEDTNQNFCHAQVLSDESWDSTSTESTARSDNNLVYPDRQLRIFEWPFPDMPSDEPPPKSPVQADAGFHTPHFGLSPVKKAYAPLKVVTTATRRKLFLPGHKYESGVDPASVSILSPDTKSAAVNGILQGSLCEAKIEKGTDWAKHTHIQGWNGRMYFNLPSRNSSKDLAETYRKWSSENRKLLRVNGRGDGVPKDREQRHKQRRLNKGRMTLEVYEASQHRPTAICYVPVHLGLESDLGREDLPFANPRRSLDNLFFIRYRECDVPHYYFWLHNGAEMTSYTPYPISYPTIIQGHRPIISKEDNKLNSDDD